MQTDRANSSDAAGPLMVGLDGSDKDGRAVAVARAISRLSGRHIHLVRAIERPAAAVVEAVPAHRLNDEREQRVSAAKTELAALASSLNDTGAGAATWTVLEGDEVARRLIDESTARDALVIILATRAAGAGTRVLAGSVADRVMRESPRPVVLVPPGAAFLAGKDPRITRVLVPLDGSSLALRSLEFLVALPEATRVEYVLLEIVDDDANRAAAEARLRTSAAWLRSRGVARVEEIVGVASDVPLAIVNAVRDVLPDAIAMSTRGAGGLGRLMLGSVAEGVVRRSELPVMLLTPHMLARRVAT